VLHLIVVIPSPGQVLLSVPFDPVCPCIPFEPLTSNLGLIVAASWHANSVTDNPGAPEYGTLPDFTAYDAVNATVDTLDNGTLAVVVNKE
jgi:hypothetical protein